MRVDHSIPHEAGKYRDECMINALYSTGWMGSGTWVPVMCGRPGIPIPSEDRHQHDADQRGHMTSK